MNPSADSHFNPAFHFLGLVQKAIADGVTRHCIHPSSPEIYIVPAEQQFYCSAASIESLEALCLAAPFDLSVNPAPNWRPPSKSRQDVQAGRTLLHRKNLVESHAYFAKPLSALLWYATLCASQGRLLSGHEPDVLVHLRAKPDFSTWHICEPELILANFWAENTADLPTASYATGVPLPKVFDFYNACVILGLVAQNNNLFFPEDYLPGLLAKAYADQQPRSCAADGGKPLVIVPKDNLFYTELDANGIAQLCATKLSKLEIAFFEDKSEQEEIVQIGRTQVRKKKANPLPKGQGRPLSFLLFRAALYGSQGRLLEGFDLGQRVWLATQPDVSLLRECASIAAERYIFPVTAFIVAKQGLTLPEIAKATQQPLPKVIDFYNACALSGIIAGT